MISHHRMRDKSRRSRSRDREYLHAHVAQLPQSQPMVIQDIDIVLDEDSAVVNPSSPSVGLPPSAEQRGRSRREQRFRSRMRAPPHVPSRASQQPQPVVPPSGAQQLQPLATQGTDEDSATVEPQSRVSDRSRWPQRKESPQKQGSQKQKRKENYCRNETTE